MTVTRISAWWAAAHAMVFAAPVVAGELGVSAYAELGVSQDSNLFRLADEARPTTGDGDRGDNIRHRELGLNLEWPTSRQRFVLDADIGDFRYSSFDQLDHSENQVRAAWEFEAGSAVHGTAGYQRQRYLDDFSDRDNTQPDFIRQQQPQIEAFLDITPDWRARVLADRLAVDHSLSSQQRFNRRENRGLLALHYLGAPDSTLGAGVEVVDGTFPGRDDDDPLARSFLQNTVFVDLNWKYSGISRFYTRLGYTQRNNSGGGDRDFSGITGHLGYERTFSAKTQASAELFRQIYSVDDVDANSVQETGARLRLTWTYSPKLDLSADISHRWQDYQTLSDGDSRRDTVNEFVAELTYRPYRQLALVLNTRAIQRDSDAPGESYDTLIGGFAVRVALGDVAP